MQVTQLESTNQHAPPRHVLPEVELLRIKVAQLAWELAQVQVERLQATRDVLIRQTLGQYVPTADVESYVIDLASGAILPRQEGDNER